MEKNNNIPNEAAPVIQNLTADDIPRCPSCNLISSLKLNYKENKPMINYECENNHIGNILLEEYMTIYNKFSLLKEKCGECNKSQKEIKGDFFYCSKCTKYLCSLCVINHIYDDNHNIINLKRYDSFCKIHSNLYCFYCVRCKINLCIYCKPKHNSHDLIDLSELNYSEESKKKLEEEINNIEKKIQNLDELKKNIILQIDQLKKSSEYEIKFIKILLFTYQYEENYHNLNFNVIQNLKNFEKTFKSNKIEIYEKIYKEGNKYISLLQSNNIKFNSFKNNFKTLKNHTKWITFLSQLNDGRLMSSSGDYSLNIYNNNSFELQLSIKEHSDYVRSFTQLKDGKIISCSNDQTMKLIKLIEEDKYKLEQTLQGHSSYVYKVIEIKENELISVSYDKTMKIWKINNENKFECIKTITFQNTSSMCNILKINENEFVTSSTYDKCIKFWNSYYYSNNSTITSIEIEWTYQTMCLIEDDILCIGGNYSKGFYLIKISTHQIIKNIIGPKTIYSISKCLDGLFLCSMIDENGYYSLVKYKYEEQNLKKVVEKVKAHDSPIHTCIELNDGTIASGGFESLIKLWND